MARLALLPTGSIVVSLLALASPPTASAGEVSLVPDQFCAESCRYMNYEPGTSLQFRARPGEANVVTVTEAGATFTIRDASSPLTAGVGCKAIDAQTASCSPPSGLPFIRAIVDLGDGDDVLSVTGSIGGRPDLHGATAIAGGPGNDRVSAGNGPETLDGGAGADELRGEGGDDFFVADESPRASDVFDGGTGVDAIGYDRSTVPVRVDLGDPAASQGEAGEADRISATESVRGGGAGDSLLGDAARNRLMGEAGADLLAGGGGDDALFGGPGRDALSGGAGDDALDVQDGGADDVACGEGLDRLGIVIVAALDSPISDEYTTVDAKDEIAPDCERVQFVSSDGDALLPAVVPRSVQAGAVSFGNPCPRRKRCRGVIQLRYGSRSKLAGRRSFDRGSSRVVVPINTAAKRLLAFGRPARFSVRWTLVLPDQFGVSTYRTTYRTTIAVPPATGRPRTG